MAKRVIPLTYEAVVKWLETKPGIIEGVTRRGCWANAFRKFKPSASTRHRNFSDFIRYMKQAGYDLRPMSTTYNRNRLCLCLPRRTLTDEIPLWMWFLPEPDPWDFLRK